MRFLKVNRSDRTVSSESAAADRDRGAVLPLVLVLIVIGSLIVIPVLSYATTVTSANTVLSAKTKRFEAVKSGLRTSLYDPLDLYRQCDLQAAPKPYASTEVNGVEVQSTCQIVGNQRTAINDFLRYGLVTTEVGQSVPTLLKGKKYSTGTNPSEWVTLTTSALEDSPNETRPGTIWLPDLPSYPLINRTRVQGYDMPSSYGGCKVYFPGKYVNDVVLTGPTFFTSGIYYFEGSVRVEGGASVVVGDGQYQGCATSQEAVFFSEPTLASTEPHSITGYGATWLFGGAGKLTVSNSNGGQLKLIFNRRYVDDRTSDPSLFVSIASVNGQVNADGTHSDLVVPGTNPVNVPLSRVLTAPNTYLTPLANQMVPSSLTTMPNVPAAPVSVTATAFRRTTPSPTVQGAYIKWSAPPVADQGGSPIERYEVFVQGQTTPISGCTRSVAAGDPLDCVVTGLAGSSGGTTHTFEVVAYNVKGASPRVATSVIMRTSGTPTTYTAPTVPAPAVPASTDRFLGAVRVTVPNVTPGSLPVTRYTISAERQTGPSTWAAVGTPCTIDPRAYRTPPVPAFRCTVKDLGLVSVTLRFKVTAENQLVSSAVTGATSTAMTLPIGLSAAPADEVLPPPPGLPVVPPIVPVPIVDIDLSSANPASAATSIRIPGYIAVPQGTVRINNSFGGTSGHPMQVVGGIIAARMNVTDGRVAAGCTVDCVDLGFQSEVVQRRLRIESSTPDGVERSVAIVQVNENGAYAVNSWEVQ